MKTEAMFYEVLEDKVHCFLCPHNCLIKSGASGKCNVRINDNGKLYTLNYGEVTSISLDPIEKKPLYYFKPKSKILSAGSFGCNFTCQFCQNYRISQHERDRNIESDFISKENLAKIISTTQNNIGIAFTYNEPSIWYEYVFDCSRYLKEVHPDMDVVLITNGYINIEPLEKLLPYVDAMNIDIKSFNDMYYKKLCNGRLKPVMKTIQKAAQLCHVEITALLVTGENDNIEEIEKMSKFISSISKDIPFHLSRYFPRYKMENPPTDLEFMKKAQDIAGKYLNKVSLGNV